MPWRFNPFTGNLDETDIPAFNGEVALGSAASPSIFFTGDPNTGIYSPGADQVALSTGGTGRLFVDSSGNLIQYSDTTLERQHRQQVASAYTATNIKSVIDGATGYLTFETGTNWTNGNAVERLRITSDGKVGLGTSSPGALFHAVNTSAGAATLGAFIQNANSTANTEVRLGFSPNSNVVSDNRYAYIGAINVLGSTDNSLTFGTGAGAPATERMRIDSSGRVGVGTTGPLAKLAVEYAVAGSGSDGIRLSDTTNTTVTLLGTTETTYSYAGVTGHSTLLYGSRDLAICADNANSGQIKFSTGGSEAMRVDASRRLLVGTSSQTTSSLFTIKGNSSNSAGASEITLQRGEAATSITSGESLGHLYFTDNNNNKFAEIAAWADAAAGSGDYPGRLVFSTTADGASSPTERMKLDNRGQLSLQSTTSAFDVATTQAAGTVYSTILSRHSATSGLPGTGTLSFRVYSNGDVQNTNNSYGAISDIKLKENIVDASSQWDDIKALRPVKYNFKPETGQQTHTQIGLIAQEVEQVSPGLVSESPDLDEDGNDLGTVTKSVNYSVLYMKAVKALQEAMERIETLEAKVAALETP